MGPENAAVVSAFTFQEVSQVRSETLGSLRSQDGCSNEKITLEQISNDPRKELRDYDCYA